MAINLLANKEHYRADSGRKLESNKDVMNLIKEYLRSEVSATDEQFDTIFGDMKKERNQVVRFDSSDEVVTRFGNEGERVAYGAFKYSALEHSVQTSWSYTFEILDTGEQYYVSLDSWGWLPDVDLEGKVTTLLE